MPDAGREESCGCPVDVPVAGTFTTACEQGAPCPAGRVPTGHDCPDCRCQQRSEVAALHKTLFRRDDGRRSPTGNCWDVEDVLDGFFVHAAECPQVGHGWTGGFGCIGLARWKGAHEPWMKP